MIFRAFAIFMSLFACFYGLIYAISCTKFFRDPARVRRIVARVLIAFGSIVLALTAFAVIATGESLF